MADSPTPATRATTGTLAQSTPSWTLNLPLWGEKYWRGRIGELGSMRRLFQTDNVVKRVCSYLPLIKERHRCLTFLRLRVACRAFLWNVTRSIANRAMSHLKMADKDPKGCRQAEKIRDSGCLSQFLLPLRSRNIFRSGLWYDESTGRPMGMTQDYWDQAGRLHRKLGWTEDKVHLML